MSIKAVPGQKQSPVCKMVTPEVEISGMLKGLINPSALGVMICEHLGAKQLVIYWSIGEGFWHMGYEKTITAKKPPRYTRQRPRAETVLTRARTRHTLDHQNVLVFYELGASTQDVSTPRQRRIQGLRRKSSIEEPEAPGISDAYWAILQAVLRVTRLQDMESRVQRRGEIMLNAVCHGVRRPMHEILTVARDIQATQSPSTGKAGASGVSSTSGTSDKVDAARMVDGDCVGSLRRSSMRLVNYVFDLVDMGQLYLGFIPTRRD